MATLATWPSGSTPGCRPSRSSGGVCVGTLVWFPDDGKTTSTIWHAAQTDWIGGWYVTAEMVTLVGSVEDGGGALWQWRIFGADLVTVAHGAAQNMDGPDGVRAAVRRALDDLPARGRRAPSEVALFGSKI